MNTKGPERGRFETFIGLIACQIEEEEKLKGLILKVM
jgi:hypothetical protein